MKLMGNFEYIGSLHIHSRHSDGAWRVPRIAQCAKRAGLDFIILNDHAHMSRGLHLEEEGIYDGVVVLMGLEIGEKDHHYLAFGLDEMVGLEDLSPQAVIDRVNARGGFGFLAHPFEKGMPFFEKSVAYTWNDLSVSGYTGICIWNFSSRWKERVRTPFHGLFFLLFKSLTLKGPHREVLSFWDARCLKRKTVAIGGADAHGAEFRWGFIRFTPLSYDVAMRAITVHLVMDERMPAGLEAAKAAIYGAMKRGRLFVAHDRLAPARGFRFYFEPENGGKTGMGEERPFEPGVLHAAAPGSGEIRFIRNGTVVKRCRGRQGELHVAEPGVYRVEVYRRVFPFGDRPWIFSNPVYLR